MKLGKLILVAIIFLEIVTFAQSTLAEIRYLVMNSNECPTGTPTPACDTNFKDAVTNAQPGDSIEIRPGTYPTGNVTLNKNVSLYGLETARTFLDGGNSGAILTIDGLTNGITVQRLTFIRASSTSSGLVIQNSSSVIKICNCIFEAGESSSAIQTINSSATEITHNVFYKNGGGIVSDTTTSNIINNIFFQSGNVTAISPATMDLAGIRNNLFSGGLVGPAIVTDPADPAYKGNITNQDPLFVNPNPTDVAQRDFHLRAGSPAIDAGDAGIGSDKIDTTPPDIGAYGGPNSDAAPFPVADLVVTGVTGTSPATVSISWTANASYRVGGYFVYYGASSGNYGTPVDSSAATYSLEGLTSAVLSAPTGTPVVGHTIDSGTIYLDWSSSVITNPTGTGVIGYEIRYDTIPGIVAPPNDPSSTTVVIDVQSATSHSLQNLENGTPYYFIVTPFTQTVYYIAVKAYYSANKAFLSNVFSNEVQARLNDRIYGTRSIEDSDFPEAVAPYPNLPDSGCFIATAAYGYYSAPQVQALRRFRDAYLLTNAPGKAFVRWYYRYGPLGAEFLNAHPWLKPVVRVALLPAVGVALFMACISPPAKAAVFLFIAGVLILSLAGRRRLKSRGGIR